MEVEVVVEEIAVVVDVEIAAFFAAFAVLKVV